MIKQHSLSKLGLSILIGASLIITSLSADTTEDPTQIHPLFEGIKAPEAITVKTSDGMDLNLTDKLNAGPTVLVFYRGGWCPYCNQQLADLGEIEPDLVKLGYTIVALSADSPESLHSFLGENPFAYELYSDAERKASDAFGLTFRVNDETYEKYKNWGLDLEAASGNPSHELPVPGVFIINNGTIQFAYVNPDYTIRLDGAVLLTAAKAYR